MENTQKIQNQTVEFLAHDLKGNKIVLQRNVEHPGTPFSSSSSASQGNSSLKRVVSGKGSLRFFSDVSNLSNTLRKKVAIA